MIEDLNVKGLAKKHKLAKSISDPSWSLLRQWLEYFAKVLKRELIIVPPRYTSTNCSSCGKGIKKL